MLGRREWVAAALSALMAGTAVVVLAGLDDGKVVEVRVQGQEPALPELTQAGEPSTTINTTAPTAPPVRPVPAFPRTRPQRSVSESCQ